jgi:hypothetical protein
MNEHNALIVGLGHVGKGRGCYAIPGNSHLSALIETKKYQIFGTDKTLIQDQNLTYLSWNNLIMSDLEFDLIVDCASSDGRFERLNTLNQIFNPKILLSEKPIGLGWEVSTSELLNKVRITYPRRCFESTKLIKNEILKNSICNISVKYNNGVFNALSHFFDLLSYWEISFEEDFVCLNTSEVSIGAKIHVTKDNSNLNVFDIIIEFVNGNKLFYNDFGRVIIDCNGDLHRFCELDHRYRIIYTNNNFLELPTIKEDFRNISVLKKLSDLLND